MPGAQWLTLEAQGMMQQLGYLGLLLLVYEGKINLPFLHGRGFEHDDGGTLYCRCLRPEVHGDRHYCQPPSPSVIVP